MDIEKLNAVSNRDGEYIGDAVYWSIGGVNTDLNTLKNLFSQHGLPSSVLPDKIDGQKVFKEAIRKASTRFNRRRKNRFLARQIENTASGVVFGIIEEDKIISSGVDTAGETLSKSLVHSVADRIKFRKGFKDVVSENSHPMSLEIMSQFEKLSGLLGSNDIMHICLEMMKELKAFPLRDRGGVYFVPSDKSEILERFASVIEMTGLNVRLYRLNIYGSNDSTRSVSDAANNDLKAELSELVSEIKSFGTDTKDYIIDRRVAKLKDLRSRASYYSEILGLVKCDIEDGITEAEKSLLNNF